MEWKFDIENLSIDEILSLWNSFSDDEKLRAGRRLTGYRPENPANAENQNTPHNQINHLKKPKGDKPNNPHF